MLHRFVESIRHSGAPKGFDGYYTRLTRGGLAGAPTRGEARRDFRAVTNRPNFIT